MELNDDTRLILGLAQDYDEIPEQHRHYLFERDKRIVEQHSKAILRPKTQTVRKCSKCGKSTRKRRVCDVCFAWEGVFAEWYRNDPVGKRIYNLVNDSLYKEQITKETFSDYVELGEMVRLYSNYGLPDDNAKTYDIAHLYPKKPRRGKVVGMHTRNNLVIVPSHINRRMGNYIFSENIGESVCIEGKRRILNNQWGVISKRFNFIEEFKKLDWFKEERSLEQSNTEHSPRRLLNEQAERFGVTLSGSLPEEDKWVRLLMHCLDSEQVEIESISGFHKALVGFGTEYLSKSHYYLKGLDERFYRRWCIARGYNPEDELVLKAVEWFIHWQAEKEEKGIWESYQHYKHRESYDPVGFPFLMEVYSSSIRLIIKVIRDYPEHDMDLQYAPEKEKWVFPRGLKLEEGEVGKEVELLFEYFSEIYFNYKTKSMDVDVDEEMIAMQIAFLGGGRPERIKGSVLGDYCEYPIVLHDDIEAWDEVYNI
jgi:ribosomal protein L32